MPPCNLHCRRPRGAAPIIPIAVFPTDVCPERLTIPIWKVLRIVELVDFGQLLATDRLTHPHRRIRIVGADRQYSAIPSMNHNGSVAPPRCLPRHRTRSYR